MRKRSGVVKICKCCNQDFYVPKYRSVTANFCSTNCLNTEQYSHHKKECQRCHKVFMVSNSRVNKKFCSSECQHFSRATLAERRKACKRSSIISRGKFTGKTLRKFVFDYKEKKCEICGYNEYDFCLDIHHLDENSHNNDLSNLKVLCCMCHKKLHKGVINADQIR